MKCYLVSVNYYKSRGSSSDYYCIMANNEKDVLKVLKEKEGIEAKFSNIINITIDIENEIVEENSPFFLYERE